MIEKFYALNHKMEMEEIDKSRFNEISVFLTLIELDRGDQMVYLVQFCDPHTDDFDGRCLDDKPSDEDLRLMAQKFYA